MPEIRIQVANKIATNLTPNEVIVCGNSDYTIAFSFDAEWNAEPTRTARFTYFRNGRNHYKECTFEGSIAPVPVLSGIREVHVGVYAGDLHTTTPVRVLCRQSILCGDAVEQITPAEKEGLQTQVDQLTLEVDDLKENGTGGKQKPLVLYGTLDNEYPEMYLNDSSYGDEALRAILTGRQILVRVPDAVLLDGRSAHWYDEYSGFTATFSPVLMYQLPNRNNDYLYLFYLRDEKQIVDLSAAGLGQIQVPVYGQLKMKLSTKYMECPLEPKTTEEWFDILNQ